MSALLPVAAIVAVALSIVAAVLKAVWRVAEPDEALIVSGARDRADHTAARKGFGFRIVTGGGTLVKPGIETVRRLSLDLRQAEVVIEGVTHQGIPLGVKGAVIFKVGDDDTAVANAARRFLGRQDQMEATVHHVFAGHLRAIVGSMTVEELIRDRAELAEHVRRLSATEMANMGLIVESLHIQEIDDPTGYMQDLGTPYAAAVAARARIAQAHADLEATEQERLAEARKAECRRDAELAKAGYQAEIDQATARREIGARETNIAELRAKRP
jgi:uncharacterized membrane protein YqiK